MRKIVVSFVFCVSVLAWGASTAVAELLVSNPGGDKVVLDQNSGLYWYPHLMDSGLVQKTKAQQYAFIDGLNQNGYGGRRSWRFATLHEMIAMLESMTNAPGITCQFPAPYGPGTVCDPVPILDYFENTGYYMGAGQGHDMVFTGRTADEWALREDPLTNGLLPVGSWPFPIPDQSVVGTQWGEGEYHIPYNSSTNEIRYDDDTNYIADHQLYGPLPFMMPAAPKPDVAFVCSAWIVADPYPIPTVSGGGLVALAIAMGGAAFFAVRRRKRAS
ncbi:MAG: hypothetical protein JRK53_17170 [Deltaproteobacteria bacterium]|nr:hypothetical protein [Deltaproteobacteria bacterium]MBW2286027.1 hypothetical protein [Deltaproteobacteria bacterium]